MSTFDKWLFRIEKSLAFSSSIVIFLLVLITFVNVIGRWLFSFPISGYVDWIEQAMAFIAFLGLAYTQRLGGHIRMDLVIKHLGDRWLWFVEWFSLLLMFIISVFLIYGSYLHFFRAFEIGDSSLDIQLPTWPAKIVVPVALLILSIRLITQFIDFFQAWLHNRPPILQTLADKKDGEPPQ